MTMTRKDYQIMADVLHITREIAHSEAAIQVLNADETSDTIGLAVDVTFNVVVNALAVTLSQDNPNFNTARFLAAVQGKKGKK